jgi:hypothetical protein
MLGDSVLIKMRMSNNEFRISNHEVIKVLGFGFKAQRRTLNLAVFISSTFNIRYSLFVIRYFHDSWPPYQTEA